MVGKTPVALLITVLYALMFCQSQGKVQLEKFCNDALVRSCVILVTGAGGMFGGVLRASGIGTALADVLRYRHAGDPAAFPVSAALRVAQGSATVALTTTAALMAPTVAATTGLSELDLTFIVIAIAGAPPCSPTSMTPALAGQPLPQHGREDHPSRPDRDGDPARHHRLPHRGQRPAPSSDGNTSGPHPSAPMCDIAPTFTDSCLGPSPQIARIAYSSPRVERFIP